MESPEITEFLKRGFANVQIVRRSSPQPDPFNVLAADARGLLVETVAAPKKIFFYPWSEILEVRERN